MIWPVSWFPYIIWFTWPFLALMTVNWPAATAAEVVWLGFLGYRHERRAVRRGRTRP